MKTITTLFAACTLIAGAASAQSTTQQSVLGQSGQDIYTLEIQGTNGVVFNCKPEIISANGVPSRECVRPSGSILGNGSVAAGAAAAGIALVIIALMANSD